MLINRYGEIAKTEWYRNKKLRNNIELHEFIIMPNHLHGIIEIVNCNELDCRGTAHRALMTEHQTPAKEQFGKPSSNTIPTIIRSYKASVTKRIRELSKNPHFHIWQRSYFEHIIRNEDSYLKISEYIQTNPLKWRLDKYFG